MKRAIFDSWKTIIQAEELFDVLIRLDLEEANNVVYELNQVLDSEYCGDCESHRDDCECDTYPDHWPEYDDGASFEDY